MPHSTEGQTFLARLAAAPDVPGANLDGVLQPSLDEEQELRKLFVQDKTNARLDNPHVGLVDVFGSDTDVLRKTRARVVDSTNEEDLSGKYIMPLTDAERREYGKASMVADIAEFKKNWSIFTEGSLSQLFDWSNVIAAGGAVLSALSPLPEDSKKSKRAIRKYYHSKAYPSSDVDLFLWGLTPEQAEKKIIAIYEAVRDSVPWDVTCVRTKHTISIHSQYPYRSVQIVLRLYRSPAEVLAGFDIDAPCCAYDGERVWANPRAIMAMIRQCNTIDVTRRSPSYEVRLAKYSKRGFEIYVPNLMRKNIDPTIYERSIIKIEGLARLLALEKLQSADARYKFLDSRRELRGRPFALRRPKNRQQRKYRGDLKKTEVGGLEMNDYDVASLHIPYGPGWTSKRIEKLIYQTDLGMNSTFNPKNKGRRLHRHAAFFGTIEECMEDCCENCPEPIDDDERTLQKEEDEHYVRGRISFIQENPGRQSLSGSFNPIDEGEWSEQVYVRPIQKLFNAIAAHDISLVRGLLEENRTTSTIDLQHRDHVGRTALHLAILVKDEEIAKVLVDEGCRMIARLVDGRTALHLAAQYGLGSLIEKMFERSEQNKKAAEKEEKTDEEDEEMKNEAGPPDTTTDAERPSSEDDWSSDENDGKDDRMDVDDEGGDSEASEGSKDEEGDKPKEEEKNPDGEVPEDEDEPDVLDVNVGDWDQGFAPLHYAVLYSTRSTVDLLLKHEADPTQAAIASTGNSWEAGHSPLPLFLTLVRPDEDTAVDIAERLLEAGTSSSTADEELITMLHYAVFAQKTKILDMFLRRDSGAKMALDFPWVYNGNSRFPVVSAVTQGAYATLLTLLAHGAKINPTAADVTRAKAISGKTDGRIWGYGSVDDYSTAIYQPVETALARGDYIIIPPLLEAGADVNNMTFTSLRTYKHTSNKNTILDWVVDGLEHLENSIKSTKDESKNDKEVVAYTPLEKADSWKEYFDDFCKRHHSSSILTTREENETKRKERIQQLESLEKTREYLQQVHSTLKLFGAKTWKELYEEPKPTTTGPMTSPPISQIAPKTTNINEPPKPRYKFLSKSYYRYESVPHNLSERYDALFEAAFKGDDAKIEKLCVPSAEETDASVVPVQITVEAIISDGQSLGVTYYNNTGSGLTPLHAAIAGKRWNTAKLIMGIAAAQYHDDSADEEEKWRASLFKLVDEDEDEDDDDMSTYSDSTVDGRERQAKFVDIAKKITIRTDVHPSLLFNRATGYVVDNKRVYETLQGRAISENNFEAFVHLFDIQESLGTTNYNQVHPFFSPILTADNPKFLDELIRRTGVGIDIETVRQTSGEDHPIALNDQNRLYLGLNIHGKKRADLARKGDPNAPGQRSRHIPILWSAIGTGAKSIVEYLASEKPLSAYKHFAANGQGDKAEWLRHSKTIGDSLSEWLGWSVSPVGENPLTVAISSNQKEILPILFSKAAKLMGTVLHAKIKFLGFNGLLFAAAVSCDKDIFDFLLKKGVSATESDSERGWNVYHWVCSNKQRKLLEYLLERLPRDVSEELLLQRSKTKLDTPLQMAVKAGAVSLVQTILGFTQEGLLVYDAYGFTPLHNAIRKGHPLIAQEILKVIPEEGLYLENGVGKTPYEDAQKRAMKPTTNAISKTTPSALEYSSGARPTHVRLNIDRLEKELQHVIDSLNRLVRNGILEKGSKLANAFETFVSATEGRLVKEKARAAEIAGDSKSEDEVVTDTRDAIATFEATAKAVQGGEAKRTLIHLKDVQLSVETDLQRVAHEEHTYSTRYNSDDEEEGDKERGSSLIFAGFSASHYM